MVASTAGPLTTIRRLATQTFEIPVTIKFRANVTVGTTVALMINLLGLRDGPHYQLETFDWEFSITSDPVDATYDIWLVQGPRLPVGIDEATKAMLAHMSQEWRIGAGTLTAAQTSISELLNIDLGVMSEDIDDKLSIVARADISVALYVTGLLKIIETITQRSWVHSASIEEIAAFA